MKNKRNINTSRLILISFFTISLLWLCLGSAYYQVSPFFFIEKNLRHIAIEGLTILYKEDTKKANDIRETYLVGDSRLLTQTPEYLWQKFHKKYSYFTFDIATHPNFFKIPLFVYEKVDSPQLQKLKSNFNLEEIIKAPTEYESMLRMAAWIGQIWDHGQDSIPGDGDIKTLDVSEVIKAGMSGKNYWCDIAARVTVQVATAVGWPARLVSLSKDGYTYDHAVAELWSNDFDKWFVIDTDFNVVFESDNIPLSAYELCHNGPDLQKTEKLEIIQFCPSKKSLKYIDLIPYFAYVHIDLRNDWYTRRLPRGSPEGSDLATFYTTRQSIGPLLTKMRRIDNQELFDWPVNTAFILPKKLVVYGKKEYQLIICLAGYTPYYKSFLVKVDDSPWVWVESENFKVHITDHKVHSLEAQVLTTQGWLGPASKITFKINPSTTNPH